MNYPLITEYVEAVKAAEDNFKELTNLRPVLGEDGEPVMSSGNFAVVFKMEDEKTGKLYAVKCFLREQEGRAEAYRQIAEELEYVSSTFLTPIKYLDKELFVDTSNSDESEFPVLLMDWVEGQTLDKYIREHIDDQYELSLLAYQFSRLAMWLLPQPFAHGDLKPDNILVKNDGTLVLVDYDGMYVPAMKGQRARELGSPDFRHPSRTENDFDEHIDDFSLVSILLSLKAIAIQPELLEQYGASDRLLFSANDYRNLSESQVMDALKNMMQDTELATLYSLFILSSAQNNLSQTSFRLLNLSRPQLSTVDDLGTIVVDELLLTKDRKRLISCLSHDKFIVTIPSETRFIDEYAFFEKYSWWYDAPPYFIRFQNDVLNHFRSDYAKLIVRNDKIKQSFIKKGFDEDNIIVGDVFVDDFGVIYSEDKTKLLCFPKELEIEEYHILEECEEIICGGFNYLPDPDDDGTVSIRGNKLKILHIPSTLKKVGKNALEGCVYLNTFVVPQGLISYFLNLLPNKFSISFLEETEYYSTKITKEDLDNAWTDEYGVMYSADRKRLLKVPKDIEEYTIKAGTKVICNGFSSQHEWGRNVTGAFKDCSLLHSLVIPDSITTIGNVAFEGCISLIDISIPDSVTQIGAGAFSGCKNLRSVVIPNNLKEIANEVFSGCVGITNIIIPYSVTKIGRCSFYCCEGLSSIIIPKEVVEIGEEAFAGCINLVSVTLSSGIKNIGYGIFNGCRSLDTISMTSTHYMFGQSLKDDFGEKIPEYKDLLWEVQDTEMYSTSISDYDKTNNNKDKYGVIYSKDGKRLLWAPKDLIDYSIKEGTKFICEYAFKDCIKLKSINIPSTVKEIGEHAFEDCCQINTIVIPNCVTKIGGAAFSGCKSLTSISLSNRLEVIAGQTFRYCSGLNTISLPNKLTTIESHAFEWCKGLASIFIPANVRYINSGSFAGCSNLNSIIVDRTNPYFDSHNNCDAIIKQNILVVGCVKTKIPTDVTTIGEEAFAGCLFLKTIVIPNSIKRIEAFAFNACTDLETLEIPTGVTSIGTSAFEGCQSLNSITIPNSVNKIGWHALWNCPSLHFIYIPKGTKKQFEIMIPSFERNGNFVEQ